MLNNTFYESSTCTFVFGIHPIPRGALCYIMQPQDRAVNAIANGPENIGLSRASVCVHLLLLLHMS